MTTKDLFTKKSATLRRSAHQILNIEEREILKHVMRVYRQSGSLDTLCASLAKIVTDNSKLELINLISDMFPVDLSTSFLHRCETRIPIYAMKRKQREANNALNNKLIRHNNNNNNSDVMNMGFNSSSFSSASVLNRSASTMVMSLPQCPTPSPPVREKEVWRLSRSRSTPRACATVTPRTAEVPSSPPPVADLVSDKEQVPLKRQSVVSYTAPRRSRFDSSNSSVSRQNSVVDNKQCDLTTDVDDLFSRINQQITKVRPPLSLLMEKGFWQAEESPPADETFVEARRRRRRSSSQIVDSKQLSNTGMETTLVKSTMSEYNINNNSDSSDSFQTPPKQSQVASAIGKSMRPSLYSSKAASFDNSAQAFAPVLTNSKSSHNFRVPVIQVSKPINNKVAKLTGRQLEEHRFKLGSESPPTRKHSRRNRRLLLFRAPEPPYDVEIKGVDEKDFKIPSPFLPITAEDLECNLPEADFIKHDFQILRRADELDLFEIFHKIDNQISSIFLQTAEIQTLKDRLNLLCSSKTEFFLNPVDCSPPARCQDDLKVSIHRSILDESLPDWSSRQLHQTSCALQTDCHQTQDISVQTLGQGLDTSTQTEQDLETEGTPEMEIDEGRSERSKRESEMEWLEKEIDFSE